MLEFLQFSRIKVTRCKNIFGKSKLRSVKVEASLFKWDQVESCVIFFFFMKFSNSLSIIFHRYVFGYACYCIPGRKQTCSLRFWLNKDIVCNRYRGIFYHLHTYLRYHRSTETMYEYYVLKIRGTSSISIQSIVGILNVNSWTWICDLWFMKEASTFDISRYISPVLQWNN